MKKIFKFLIFSLGILTIFCFLLYAFYKNNYKQNVKSNELNFFIWEIKKAKALPDNFYFTYEKINPKSIENDLISSFYNKTECQSQRIARRIFPIIKKQNVNRFENLTFEYFSIIEIEKNTDQKQCLNWTTQEFDFQYGVKGIENAAKFYFKKNLKILDETELETLILMLDNPSKYNPLKN